MKTNDIRCKFKKAWLDGNETENGMIEIVNASFIADEETIFGELNEEYAKNEVAWYLSTSLSIHDMQKPIPKIWKEIASKCKGRINSNYGWCIFSENNYEQFNKTLECLIKDKHSRQAVMIYIRPSIHEDAFADGMKDFMCTYAVQILIRNNELHYIVNMRSNDAIFGYKNDRYWHNIVFNMCLERLSKEYTDLEKGNLYWNAGSLHIYPRHFHLIKESMTEDGLFKRN